MKPLCSIDGIEKTYPDGLVNLEEVLFLMRKREIPENDVVSEVRINGSTYSEAYENQSREVDLKTIEGIEIFTRHGDDFARDAIRQASLYLDDLERGFRLSVRLLRSYDQREKGCDMFARSIEALQALKSFVDQVDAFLKVEGHAPGDDALWKRFNPLADRLITLQEKPDLPAIADLLENELLPFLRTWREKRSRGL